MLKDEIREIKEILIELRDLAAMANNNVNMPVTEQVSSKGLTLNDLTAQCRVAVTKGVPIDEVRELIKSYGVVSIVKMSPEDYPEFSKALNALIESLGEDNV